MTKKLKIYQVLTFALGLAFVGLCLFVGITAVQKSMKLNLGFQVNPSFECKIVYNGNTIFCNTTKNGESLVVGNGVSLNGNNLTLNQNFSGLGAEFTLTIHNYTALKTEISVSGTGANGDTLTLDAYSSGTAPNGNITITATGASATLTFAELPPKTITLNLNGGTHASATNGEIKLDGDYDCLSLALSVVSDHIPTMTNYTFGGWYSDVVGATNVPTTQVKYSSCNYFTDNSISLAQDLELKGPTTLYARWLPFTFHKYYENGASQVTTAITPHQGEATNIGNIWKGYHYIKFAGSETRWIVIGSGDNLTASLFDGNLINGLNGTRTDYTTKTLKGPQTNPNNDGGDSELGSNQILLLREETLASQLYDGNGYACWAPYDDGTVTYSSDINDYLNGDYLSSGEISSYSAYIDATELKTAWSPNSSSSSTVQYTSTSKIFILGSKYGYFSTTGNTPEESGGAKDISNYTTQNFCVEDYLGSYIRYGSGTYHQNPRIFAFLGEDTSYWWLRSGDYNYYNYAYTVPYYGFVSYRNVFDSYGVRPSFVLNLA